MLQILRPFAAAVVLALTAIGSPSMATETEATPRLTDLCPKQTKGSISVCHEFIEARYVKQADVLVALHTAIDAHKDKARSQHSHTREWTLTIQVALIGLGFLTTMFAAVARTYRDEKYIYRNLLGLLPIISSALITLVSGFQTVYQFDARQEAHRAVADDLALLQSDMHYRLLVVATGNPSPEIKQNLVDGWKLRLDDVLERYQQAGQGKNAKAELAGTGDS